MRRSVLFLLAAAAVLSGCDLSGLLNLGNASVGEEALRIERFYFEASRNEHLTTNVEGVIQSGRIDVALPFDVVTNNRRLRVTVELPEGVLIHPTDDQAYGGEVTFTIENTRGESLVYRVLPSIDPDTLTLISVDQPFYVLGTEKIPIEEYQIVRQEHEIAVEVPIENLETYTGRAVGFDAVFAPHGTSGTISAVVYGETPPYTVSVISRNGAYETEYTVDLRHQQTSATGLRFVNAIVDHVHPWSAFYRSNQSAFTTWENGPLSPGPHPDFWTYKNRHGDYQDLMEWEHFGMAWSLLQNHQAWSAMPAGGEHVVVVSNWQAPGGSGFVGGGGGRVSIILRDAHVSRVPAWVRGWAAANVGQRVSLVSRLSGATHTGNERGDRRTVAIAPVFENSGRSYDAPATETYGHGSEEFTFNIWAEFWGRNIPGFQPSDGEDTFIKKWGLVRAQFTATWFRERMYSSADFYVVQEIHAGIPLGAIVSNVHTFPGVTGWSHENNELRFTLADTFPNRTVGAVAVFNVTAEDGGSATHFLVIE